MLQRKWVKRSLELCIHDTEFSEEEKIKSFKELENQYNSFTKEERGLVGRIINEALEEKDQAYVYSYFMYYMNLQEFQQEALRALLKCDMDCWVGSMLELQIIRMVPGCYSQKRKLHRKNIERFAKALHMDFPYRPLQKRKKNRIVIMTEQVLSNLHAPTKLLTNIAYTLQEKMGYEMLIFSCPSDGILQEDRWYKPGGMNSQELFRSNSTRMDIRGAEFKHYQINMDPLNIKEYQMMLEIIHAWNPYFVFSIGALNPITDLCGKFTTLVLLAANSSCPVSEADILLRAVKWDEDKEQVYSQALQPHQAQLFLKENIPNAVEREGPSLRSESGLPEGKFLIAVVGNRLDMEIDLEFAKVMEHILEREPRAAFAIIGDVDKAKRYFTSSLFQGRIFYLGFCSNLVSVYGMMDLYMNPKRKGGGYSSSMAMSAGIPAVSLPECDVAVHVGEGLLVKNYQEMENIVCKYVAEPRFYQEKQKYAQERAGKNTEEHMVQCIQELVGDIVALMERQEKRRDDMF